MKSEGKTWEQFLKCWIFFQKNSHLGASGDRCKSVLAGKTKSSRRYQSPLIARDGSKGYEISEEFNFTVSTCTHVLHGTCAPVRFNIERSWHKQRKKLRAPCAVERNLAQRLSPIYVAGISNFASTVTSWEINSTRSLREGSYYRK